MITDQKKSWVEDHLERHTEPAEAWRLQPKLPLRGYTPTISCPTLLSPAKALFGQTQQETRGHGSLDDVVFVGQLSKTEQNGEKWREDQKRQTEGIQYNDT